MPLLLPYPHRVRVDRLTAARDAASGGTVETYATRASDVPCDIAQQGGSRSDRFDAPRRAVRCTVFTEYADLRPGDRLYVSTGPTGTTGKYLVVVGPANHPAGLILPARAGWDCEQLLE